jgi:translation initiation factor 2 beta subunit (eIF-2beta)/eIF-5
MYSKAGYSWEDMERMVTDYIEECCEEAVAEAVVHGYWIDSCSVDHMGRVVEHGIDCSVCDSVFKDDSREVVKRWKERFKMCPFCGAKMDGERREGE